jgi:xanthine dehydrogenase accessory factor
MHALEKTQFESQRWPWYGLEHDHLPALRQWLNDGRRLVLATLVSAVGSSPRMVGSEMLISDYGECSGYVSGGCVEAAVVHEAMDVFTDGQPRLLDYGRGSPVLDLQLNCGGRIGIFVRELVKPESYENTLRHARDSRGEISIISDFKTGCWRSLEGRHPSPVGGFSRCHPVVPRLVIIGADPISLAVAVLAHQTGLEVALLRPNGPTSAPAGLNLALYDHAPIATSLARLKLDHRCAIYSLSHDETIDDAVLELALKSRVFVAGVLGSRTKIAARRARLRLKRFTDEDIDRLRMPAGIDIGAKAPFEIAVSVIAEVLAYAAKKKPLSATTNSSQLLREQDRSASNAPNDRA